MKPPTPEQMLAESTAKPLAQILATSGLLSGQRTTPPPSQDSSENEKKQIDLEERKRQWLAKWLCLKPTHPALKEAESIIYRFCCRYYKSPAFGETIVIYGENGCGKTHIARRVTEWANHVSLNLPLVAVDVGLGCPECVFAHWPSIVDGFKAQQFKVMDDLSEAALLVIDDIGAEHDPSGFGREQLYLLLSRREKRNNLVTTNFPPSQWPDMLERRIASRLFRNSTHIDLSQVPDYSTV